jgi:ADP-dependent NAD(P)H-hydrate dehydratase / NAD(P)H-hydrate epimerase
MDNVIRVITSDQAREADQGTIASEPIRSIDLMERACYRLYQVITSYISDKHRVLHFLCGPGNNGGDGLCLARIFHGFGYTVKVSVCLYGKAASQEHSLQRELLEFAHPFELHIYNSGHIPEFIPSELIIDALFGSGLKNELKDSWAEVVKKVNHSGSAVYSIDMPSGLFDQEIQLQAEFVKANKVFAIQSVRPSFFYAENKIDFTVVDAGIAIPENGDVFLQPEHVGSLQFVNSLLPSRPRHSHKGDYGHALIVGGNQGMHGAIALASKSCVESGAGKTTVWAPQIASPWLASIPHAMQHAHELTAYAAHHTELGAYNTLAIGPGLGQKEESAHFLQALLEKWHAPVLLDADALNLLAQDTHLWELVKPGSIITPHPGEFERLFGHSSNSAEKDKLSRSIAHKKGIFILAKNTFSALYTPEGKVFYNGSGSPSLAHGGSGDILTGLIAGYWAQTKNAQSAAILGMYRLSEFG